MKLSGHSKMLLADLVEHYLGKKASKVIVTNDGGVIFSEKKFLRRILGEKQDFLTTTQQILEGINAGKDFKYVKSLSAKAIAYLVMNNDRDKTVKLLYVAHLTDEAPGIDEVDETTELIDIPMPIGQTQQLVRLDMSRNMGSIIADLLNHNDHIIFEKR